MKNLPFYIHRIEDMFSRADASAQHPLGYWCMAVTVPYPPTLFQRMLAAWWVVTGKAHAVVWPNVGDLEKITKGPTS